MATALQVFDNVQVAKETTKGTGVVATKKLLGKFTINEEIDRYFSDNPRQARVTTGGAGEVIRTGTILDWDTELTFEEFLWIIHLSIIGGLTPTASGLEQTWAAPAQITGIPVVNSGTFELVRSDGSTNHLARRMAFGMVESYKISWAFNKEARMNARIFGRATTSQAPTAALTPYANREIAKSNLLKVYVDPSWATLGTTQLTGTLRSATLEVMPGMAPDYTLDGRAAEDMTDYKTNPITAKLNMVMDLDANSAAYVTDWRNGTLKFVRLKQEGSIIDTNPKTVQHDLCCRWAANPADGADGAQKTVTFDMELVQDPTSNNALNVSTVNKETAL